MYLNIVKISAIGEVMGRKRPPTLRFPSTYAIKRVLSKHVILIMQIIIRIIINMGAIRQERPSEGPILNFNERLQ